MKKKNTEVQPAAKEIVDAPDWGSVRLGMHVVPLALLVEAPENARYIFEQAKIDEMVELLKSTNGINCDAGKARRIEIMGKFEGFELIDGARRYRALKQMNAPAMKLELVDVYDGKATRLLAMMTRLGKVDLSDGELCREYQRMLEAGDYASVRELAAGTGQSGHERTIYNILSLDKCIPEAWEALEKGEISRGHAVLIAGEKPDDQARLLGMCHEVETVTIGSMPEQVTRLISVKALASIIQSQFREAAAEVKDLFAEKEKELTREKDKATSLETSATKMLDAAGDPDDEKDDDDDVDENATGTSQTDGSRKGAEDVTERRGERQEKDEQGKVNEFESNVIELESKLMHLIKLVDGPVPWTTEMMVLEELLQILTSEEEEALKRYFHLNSCEPKYVLRCCGGSLTDRAHDAPKITRHQVIVAILAMTRHHGDTSEEFPYYDVLRRNYEFDFAEIAREKVRKELEEKLAKKAAKKAKLSQLSVPELELLVHESVRTVFQNCDMEEFRDEEARDRQRELFTATDEALLKWMAKQIGDGLRQYFPADGYCGRVYSVGGAVHMSAYRTQADADVPADALFAVENHDLARVARDVFGIALPAGEPVKKQTKKSAKPKAVKAAKKKSKKRAA